jgi:hypothetical protein
MCGGNIAAHLCGSAQAVGYIGFAPCKLAVRTNLRQCNGIYMLFCAIRVVNNEKGECGSQYLITKWG